MLKKKLRIAVPHKHGFQAFVNITYSNTKEPKITGYSIDVFKAALERLKPSTPQYEFCVFDGTYDELVGNVSRGVRALLQRTCMALFLLSIFCFLLIYLYLFIWCEQAGLRCSGG